MEDLDFSKVPGVVINHSPSESERYVGSPSLAKLPDGRYVASSDYFGPGGDRGRYNEAAVFGSNDDGKTWNQLTSLKGQFWSTLLYHRDALYMMGTRGRNGDIAIRRSKDGGSTWTRPEGEEDGILARGVYHTAPVPIVVHNGRLWRAMENRGQGGHRPFLMSAPVDSDLLRASSWTFSDELGRGTDFDPNMNSWREGNVVVKPDGGLCIIIRVSLKRGHNRAALIEVDGDCAGLSFDPGNGYIHFPGGSGKKFTIRYDDVTGRYWSVVNPIAPRELEFLDDYKAGYFRNCMAVSSSRDLETWKVHHVAEYHPEFHTHAFQYPDWIFDGDDLAVVSRTSYEDGLGGTTNRHDSNFMTFHRIENFRALSDRHGI